MNGADAKAAAQVKALRAEFAGQRAAASGLDGEGLDESVPAKIEQVVAWEGKAAQVLKLRGMVERFEPPSLGILEHRSPEGLGLAHANGIGVFLHLLEMPVNVRAANDDLAPAFAKFPGQIAGAVGMQCPGRDGNHVHRGVEIHWLQNLIHQGDVPAWRRQSGQVRQDQRDQLPAAQPDRNAVLGRRVI